jgi:hypothetical protein
MKKILLIIHLVFIVISQLNAQKIKILTNHEGYDPVGPKTAVIQTFQDDTVFSVSLKSYGDDIEILNLDPKYVGKIDEWKNWYFWTIDFSSVTVEGDYYIECETNKGTTRSFPLKIQDNIFERHTISDVIFYFRGQRCVGQLNKADKKMIFLNTEGDAVDVSGGWHDASGDYGKHLSHLSFATYFNSQQIPLVVYSLAKSYRMLDERGNEDFNQMKRRLIDEILYGADFLIKIKKEGGSFYRSISGRGPGKKPEDRRITPTMNSFHSYEVGYRAGAGISIAALAIASQLGVCGGFSSETYLKSAEDAFEYLENYNIFLTNNSEENIIDDYCALAAATELYKATKKDVYKKAADKRAKSLMERLTSWQTYSNYWRADDKDRPFFHASDAGYPVVALTYYLDICDDKSKTIVLEVIKKSLNFELTVTAEVENAFGYARQLVQTKEAKRYSSFFYPHNTETAPWWQGENARISSLACAARIAGKHFSSDQKFRLQLEKYANDQINWIMGLNPFNVSMLHGTGRNNPEYMFFGSYQYTSAPGGICNGITGGLENEHDIDFNVPYSVTGKDYDWRWAEQWLPHSSWFLMAVSAGNILE